MTRYRIESFGNGLYGVWDMAARMYVRPLDSRGVNSSGWFISLDAARVFVTQHS